MSLKKVPKKDNLRKKELKKVLKSEFTQESAQKKEIHSKKQLKKENSDIFFYFFLADEALYYFIIYPNSCDLGTAHASLAFGQLRT